MYEKRQEKAATKKARKEQAAAAHPVTDTKQLPKDLDNETSVVLFERLQKNNVGYIP